MTYIYDVLLNFTDENRLIEFFEWTDTDSLEHIKKIPVIRISSKQLHELINNQVKVEKEFLEKIKSSTIAYKKTKNLEYAVLVSDINKVIALEFNSKGEIISRSSLLLDEEEEILEECFDIKQEQIPYNIKEEIKKDIFLTRNESKKRRYLLKEIENLYKDNNIDKLTFLYEELFKKDNLSFYDKYIKIKNDIEENYKSRHNDLYEIVRLSYIKK